MRPRSFPKTANPRSNQPTVTRIKTERSLSEIRLPRARILSPSANCEDRPLLRITTLCVLLTSLPAYADQCPLSLDEVLDAYSEARGGTDAARSQNALRVRAEYHEGDMHPMFDYRVMKPGFMRIKATFGDGGTFEEGFDGLRAWEKQDGEAAVYVGGDAAKALQQSAHSPLQLYGLHDMHALGATVTLRGCEVLDRMNYYVVNVKSSFGTDIDYYVSADSFRLERSRTVRPLHPTQDPTPITIEERWDDFRWIDGVLRPFAHSTWNTATQQRLSQMTIVSVQLDDEATAATFAKPEG